MFPYKYKRKSKRKSKLKNTVSSVKNYYFDAYDSILRLVKKQDYTTPSGYSKSQWRAVMIKLQCQAYINLKTAVTLGILGRDQISKPQLSCLKGYDAPDNVTFDWHDIYLKNVDSIQAWKT